MRSLFSQKTGIGTYLFSFPPLFSSFLSLSPSLFFFLFCLLLSSSVFVVFFLLPFLSSSFFFLFCLLLIFLLLFLSPLSYPFLLFSFFFPFERVRVECELKEILFSSRPRGWQSVDEKSLKRLESEDVGDAKKQARCLPVHMERDENVGRRERDKVHLQAAMDPTMQGS